MRGGDEVLVGRAGRLEPRIDHRPVVGVIAVVVEAAAVHHRRRHPDRGEAEVLDVVELRDQALEVAAPLRVAELDAIAVVVVVGRVAVEEPRGHHEVDRLAAEVAAVRRWRRRWGRRWRRAGAAGDGAAHGGRDLLGGGVEPDVVLGAVRDRDVAGRIRLGPVAVMIDLESRRWVLPGERHHDRVARRAGDRCHRGRAPAVRRAAELPGVGAAGAAGHGLRGDLLGRGIERDLVAAIGDPEVLRGIALGPVAEVVDLEARIGDAGERLAGSERGRVRCRHGGHAPVVRGAAELPAVAAGGAAGDGLRGDLLGGGIEGDLVAAIGDPEVLRGIALGPVAEVVDLEARIGDAGERLASGEYSRAGRGHRGHSPVVRRAAELPAICRDGFGDGRQRRGRCRVRIAAGCNERCEHDRGDRERAR